VEDVPPEPTGTLRTPGQWSELRGAHGSSGLLYVPGQPDREPVRLVVMFHGAGQSPHSAQRILESQARDRRFALLLPRSAGATWDAIRGQAGADLRSADALIEAAARRVAVTGEVAVAGFSDGASYALGAGTALGREVSEIIAFSPGFVANAGRPVRKPRIFISHGIGDFVLTIDQTSRVIVPTLIDAGYDVEYREFYGGHTVPPAIAEEAVDWMLSPGRPGDS
jgi:phospholipase/carboxylesterase